MVYKVCFSSNEDLFLANHMSRSISDNIMAWTTTGRDGYQDAADHKERERAIKKRANQLVKQGMKQADAKVQALEEIYDDEMKKPSGQVELDLNGPLVTSIDCIKLSHWDLLTMGGFYTFPHHDANGYCTWVSAHDGAKIWGIRHFKPSVLEQQYSSSIKDTKQLHDNVISGEEPVSTDETDIYVYVVKPGSVLCVFISSCRFSDD
jgi:hypothetical protein